MNYCLLEEAWGDKISSTYTKYMTKSEDENVKPIVKSIDNPNLNQLNFLNS